MFSVSEYLFFLLAALLLVITPGPNMIYLISRSICQGRLAGVMSLIGIVLGFIVHMVSTAIGLSAIFMALPFAYTALKVAGALYLFWLAWESIKPGGLSPFEPKNLSPATTRQMIVMAFTTSALNPKIAMFYLSLFPQFINPNKGNVFLQSFVLGSTQILVSFTVNFIIILFAAGIASWFAKNALWRLVQRYVMGGVFACIGAHIIWI